MEAQAAFKVDKWEEEPISEVEEGESHPGCRASEGIPVYLYLSLLNCLPG